MLRVPTLPADRYTAMLAGTPADDPDWPETHRAFLAAAWRLPYTAAAIRHAAPDLADAVESSGELALTRTALALDRYVNRMSTRPTPFGLTAAVAGVPFGEGRALRLTGPPLPLLRPDASWRAEPDADLPLEDGTVLVAAALAHTMAGQLWLEPAGREPARWLRATKPAAALLEAAARPVDVASLIGTLTWRFRAKDPAPARALVERLVRLGFLRGLPAAAPAVTVLTGEPDYDALPAALGGWSAGGGRPASAAPARLDAVARLAPGSRIAPQVARLAEQAAGLLALIGRGSRYPRDLARAATAFTGRFGEGAWVPAPEAVRTLTAIGALGGRPDPGGTPSGPRLALLAGLVADALAHRRTGCELDDELVARLAAPGTAPDAGRPPLPAVDVCLRVAQDADGTWCGALSGPGVVPSGTAYGRFTDLLDPVTRAALRGSLRDEESADPDRLFVELSYRPKGSAAANVGARELWRSWQLPVDVAPSVPPDRVITAQDVHVGVVGGRFELRSARLGRPLHLTQGSSLSLLLAPPLCRFLLDASANRFRHAAPFDWGAAGSWPFLPRLSRGPLVLSPARWRLAPGTDPDAEWAETWLVPRYVHLAQGSGRLLLDLRSAVSLAHLRGALARADGAGVTLEEVVPRPGGEVLEGPDGGRHVVEAVVPVVLTGPPATADVGPVPRRTTGHRPHRPGGEWLALHLAVPAAAQDALITGPLAELRSLLAQRYGIDELFFVRYADPSDELRVRIRTGTPAPPGALAAVLEWTGRAGERIPLDDVAVRTYHPETDRYGGPELIGAAERLFCHDSLTVADLLGRLPALPVPRTALTALTLDRIAALLVPELGERRELAAGLAGGRAGADAYRSHGRQLWRLRGLAGTPDDPVAAVAGAWAKDGPRYGGELAERWPGGSGDGRRHRATAALLHLHANRMGLCREQENAALGMWRRLLDREAAQGRTGSGVRPGHDVGPAARQDDPGQGRHGRRDTP